MKQVINNNFYESALRQKAQNNIIKDSKIFSAIDYTLAVSTEMERLRREGFDLSKFEEQPTPANNPRTNDRWAEHDKLGFFKGAGVAFILAIPAWAIIIAIIYKVLKAFN